MKLDQNGIIKLASSEIDNIAIFCLQKAKFDDHLHRLNGLIYYAFPISLSLSEVIYENMQETVSTTSIFRI